MELSFILFMIIIPWFFGEDQYCRQKKHDPLDNYN